MASLNEIVHPFLQLSVNITSSTDVLAAVAGQAYRIYAINLQASATVTLQFMYGTGPTNIEGARTLIAGVPLNLSMFPDMRPRYTLPANNKFTLTQTGAGTISGSIWYSLGPV